MRAADSSPSRAPVSPGRLARVMYELLCQQAEGGTPRRVYQPTKGGTPMQELAAVPSGRQAVRMVKQMDMQAPGGGDYREAGRVGLSRVIEGRMQGLIGNRLAGRVGAR